MKILWFTWKDKTHPLAGGAELLNEELAKRLVKDGHEVHLIVGGYKNSIREQFIDGYKISRVGNRVTVYLEAYKYYKNNLQGWADLVIEEINTMPFMIQWYTKEKRMVFIHQLCREIWFYQMFFPLNLVGYLVEPIYLWLLRNNTVITVSESSKTDLQRFGFKKENISIISEGIELEPINSLAEIQKYPETTMLSLGALREMKQTHHQIEAFEIAKKDIPALKLKIAGSNEGSYGKYILKLIEKSRYKNDIEYLGHISTEQKKELMQKSHFITVTSVKEGWGLIVTEANSQGTPAIVYPVDGLKDSVQDKKTGFHTEESTPQSLAKTIVELLSNQESYKMYQQNALEWAKTITFNQSYKEFTKIINAI